MHDVSDVEVVDPFVLVEESEDGSHVGFFGFVTEVEDFVGGCFLGEGFNDFFDYGEEFDCCSFVKGYCFAELS